MARPAVACSLPAGELEHVSRGLTDAGFPVFRAANAAELGRARPRTSRHRPGHHRRRDRLRRGARDVRAPPRRRAHHPDPDGRLASGVRPVRRPPASRRHDRVLHPTLRRRRPALACRGDAHPRSDVRRRQRSHPDRCPTSTATPSPDGRSSWPSSTPRAASARRPSSTNLAATLQMHRGQQVLLIDADTVTGHIANSLGLDQIETVADAWEEDEALPRGLAGVASQHSSGMRVAVLAANPLQTEHIDPVRLADHLSGSKLGFDVLVADLHPDLRAAQPRHLRALRPHPDAGHARCAGAQCGRQVPRAGRVRAGRARSDLAASSIAPTRASPSPTSSGPSACAPSRPSAPAGRSSCAPPTRASRSSRSSPRRRSPRTSCASPIACSTVSRRSPPGQRGRGLPRPLQPTSGRGRHGPDPTRFGLPCRRPPSAPEARAAERHGRAAA